MLRKRRFVETKRRFKNQKRRLKILRRRFLSWDITFYFFRLNNRRIRNHPCHTTVGSQP
jgi:hypothetical protein